MNLKTFFSLIIIRLIVKLAHDFLYDITSLIGCSLNEDYKTPAKGLKNRRKENF